MAKKALIVDDSVTIRSMVTLAFKQRGDEWEAEAAKDAEEALDILEKKDFDLIVTDINMPGIDGIELIRIIRQKPNGKKVPIIVLTTEGGDMAKQKGREAGASGWIVKPFKPEVLNAAVGKLCG